jgi:gas vesicle protein
MANGSNGFDGEQGNGGGFVMGLLTGAVIGAGLGMLFAPKAGSELRNQLSDQAGALANQASDGYKKATESAAEWVDRGREVYGKAKSVVARGADEAERYVRDVASDVSSAAATAVSNLAPSSPTVGGSHAPSSSVSGSSSSIPSSSGPRRS